MNKAFLATVCILLTAFGSFSQVRKAPAKTAIKTKTPIAAVSEIPSERWNEIIKALDEENWEKTSNLAALALKDLKTENPKQQLARLRYYYLYALAGKTAAGKMTSNELKNVIQTQIGKDFILLDRTVLADCDKSLNYVCPVKEVRKALRVTATNKAFTVIHAFEYVDLLQELNFNERNRKDVFVGGTLANFEVNSQKEKVWVMRLYFENGWAQPVEKK